MIYLPDLLDNSYSTAIEKGEEKTHRVSPSRIIKCARGAFMESLGYKEPIGPISEQNFGYGSLRHTELQKRLVKLGLLLNPDGSVVTEQDLVDGEYKEEKLTMDNPPLLGFMDGRIKAENEIGQAVLEIKTIGKKVNSILTPIAQHIDQAQLYMHITGLPEAYILYESKLEKSPDRPWKQFIVDYNQDRAEKLVGRGKYLLNRVENRKIPMKEPGCYCRNPACFDDDIMEKENIKGFTI